MSWSWTLYRYLGRQYLIGVGVIFATFMALAYSISLVDLLGRTAGKGVPTGVIVGMGFLHLPDLGQKLLPFAVLLGGVFTFVRLSRSARNWWRHAPLAFRHGIFWRLRWWWRWRLA